MRMFRLGIVAQGSQKWIGGVEYTRNLLLAAKASPKRSNIEITLILYRGMDEDLFRDVISLADKAVWVNHTPLHGKAARRVLGVISKVFGKKAESFFARRMSLRAPITDICDTHKFDFVYPFPISQASAPNTNWAAWIPDFQHRALPHFFKSAELEQRDRQFSQAIGKSPTIVLSSRSALGDMLRYYPKIAPKRSFVLSFASAPALPQPFDVAVEAQRKYSLPDKFLIVCNQFWQHKNHLVVFKALSLLKSQGMDIPLVCTGSISDYRQPNYINEVLELLNSTGLQEQVRLLGLIPRNDQVQLLRRASAVIQPSLFEGWSTIVEDSKSLGKTIFLSDLEVHIEQAPKHGFYFARNSPEALAELIAKQWSSLQPGPDLEREAQARVSSEFELKALGEKIFELAGADSKLNLSPL